MFKILETSICRWRQQNRFINANSFQIIFRWTQEWLVLRNGTRHFWVCMLKNNACWLRPRRYNIKHGKLAKSHAFTWLQIKGSMGWCVLVVWRNKLSLCQKLTVDFWREKFCSSVTCDQTSQNGTLHYMPNRKFWWNCSAFWYATKSYCCWWCGKVCGDENVRW